MTLAVPPAVSVVIVNYRKGELLLACLESVFRTADDLPIEVIVVDNASGDDTATVVPRRFPGVRLVLNDAERGVRAGHEPGPRARHGAPLPSGSTPTPSSSPGPSSNWSDSSTRISMPRRLGHG